MRRPAAEPARPRDSPATADHLLDRPSDDAPPKSCTSVTLADIMQTSGGDRKATPALAERALAQRMMLKHRGGTREELEEVCGCENNSQPHTLSNQRTTSGLP